MISFSHSGSFDKTTAWLKKLQRLELDKILAAGGRKGVQALSGATPKDTALAASSWDYEIKKTSNSLTIFWTNSDIENGYPVAVMIQYGHGTGTGGYVQGIDYINQTLRPIFDEISQTVWRAVNSA